MGQAAALIALFGLYLVAPTFLVIGGRLGLAGGAMLIAALLPVAIARLGNIDNPALGLMTMLMLPLPLFVLLLAAVGGMARRLRRNP